MKKGRIKGWAVRETGGLRCWYSKTSRRRVFLDSSKDKAKVYKTKQEAESAADLLNRKGFDYKDGTPYYFEVMEVA